MTEKKMTDKLFYQDSHLSGFEAEVISCEPMEGEKGRYEIVLDQTAFFPEGGGHSTGLPLTSLEFYGILSGQLNQYAWGTSLGRPFSYGEGRPG